MKTKTQLTMNLGRLFLGALIFSVSNMAMATTDNCKTEAREAAKLIQEFNRAGGGYTTVSATFVEEDTEFDHLVVYEVEYINPDSGDKFPFKDTLTMTLHGEGSPQAKCILTKFEKGGA